MSDWIGSFSSGDVRVPATFHGNARLLDGTETPTPPRPARHDDLQGRFEADLDISFALLVGVGYQPVDPSHPAYPLYLAARAAYEQSPPASPAPAVNPHSPDAVVMPFETTVIVTEAMALRHGLVAPGRAGAAGQGSSIRRKPVPPPWHGGAGSGALRNQGAPSPIADFGAFLDFMGDPGRHPMRATGDAHPAAAARSIVDAQTAPNAASAVVSPGVGTIPQAHAAGISSLAGAGSGDGQGWKDPGALFEALQDDPSLPGPAGGSRGWRG